jgi:hypothetical protein
MALTGELWRRAGGERVELHRAIYPGRPDEATFHSATFSRIVAEAHDTHTIESAPAALDRLLMTFYETAAMNRAYLEAEAILVRRRRRPPCGG